MPHFEHERRLEIKDAFAQIEKSLEALREDALKNIIDISNLKQKYEMIHKEKTEKHFEIFSKIKDISLKMDGDGNGKEGVIRKMDRLSAVPKLLESNTNTMRWVIGIMITANLGMFAAVITIAKGH